MDRIIMVYVLELHIMNKSHKQDFEEKKADINQNRTILFLVYKDPKKGKAKPQYLRK